MNISLILIVIVVLVLVLYIAYRYKYPMPGTPKLQFAMTMIKDLGDTTYHFAERHHPTGKLHRKIKKQEDIAIAGPVLSFPTIKALFAKGSRVFVNFYPHSKPVNMLYIKTYDDYLELNEYDNGTGTMRPVNWIDYEMLFYVDAYYT